MFRRALLSALMIIIAGGLTTTIGSGVAAAAPAQACAASSVIEIAYFAFNPSAIPPGQSSTATLTALNCTDQAQTTSGIWYGHFVGPGGGSPQGCPVIDPLPFVVNFSPHGIFSTSSPYTVPLSCTATQLTVTVNFYGGNGVLLAQGTAALQIVHATNATDSSRLPSVSAAMVTAT